MTSGETKTGRTIFQSPLRAAGFVVAFLTATTGCILDRGADSTPTSSSAPTTQPPTALRVPKASHEELIQILDDLPLPPSFQFLSETTYQVSVGLAGAKGNAVTRFYETGMSQAEAQDAVYEVLDANDLFIVSRAPAGSVDQFVETQLRGILVTIDISRTPLVVTALEPA